MTGIEPAPRETQSRMLPLHHTYHMKWWAMLESNQRGGHSTIITPLVLQTSVENIARESARTDYRRLMPRYDVGAGSGCLQDNIVEYSFPISCFVATLLEDDQGFLDLLHC